SEVLAGVTACSRIAVQLLYAGRYEPAQALLDIMTEIAAEATVAGDPAIRARIEQALAVKALSIGDGVAHLQATEESVRSCELAGDLRTACLQRVNVSNGYMELGFFLEAERAAREALAGALRMGIDFVAAIARTNLGFA